MCDGLGADLRRPDFPLGRGRVAEVDIAGELADLNGGEGSGDVARDPLLERGLGRGRAPDRDLGLGAEAGGKEHQSLDVVEMEVGEQDVHPRQLLADADPEAANAGAGVDDQGGAVGELELDAGGVAPIAVHLRPGGRNRPACPPYLDLHPYLTAPLSAPPYRPLTAVALLVLRPEEDHRALLPALGDDRQRAGLDLVLLPLRGSDLELAMCRLAPPEGLGHRPVLDRRRFAALIEGGQRVTPVLRLHSPRLLEGDSEQRPRCLVVEDQRAALVDEEGGRGEAGEEVPSKDQLERLLRHGREVSRMLAAACAKGVAWLEQY